MKKKIINQNSNYTKGKYLHKIGIPASFLVMFLYGSLLLLTGYTEAGLSAAIFKTNHYVPTFAWLLLSQSIGIIIGNFITGKLVDKINTRYILFGSFLISSLNLIATANIIHFSSLVSLRIFYFLIFSFILGICIGPINTLISILFGTLYVGSKRTIMFSSVQGMYAIGLGAIPLIFAHTVINIKNQTNFLETQKFYYIATSFAILGAIIGLLVNYKHSTQHSSSKILNEETHGKHINIKKALFFSLTLVVFVMVVETVVNWSFVRISKNIISHGDPNFFNNNAKISINILQAFGLMLVVQGLMRPLTSIFIFPYIDKKWYVLFSAILLVIGFSWITLGAFKHIYSIFIVAVILGMGIGNIWPVLFTYSVSLDNRRSSFIGIIFNIISGATLPITQIIVAVFWLHIHTSDYTSMKFLSPILLALIAAILLLSVFVLTYKYNQRIANKTNTEYQNKISTKK